MREALSALTTRGRAFLAAGGTAFLCALFLGHDELVRVGALLIVLPLATAWFLGRSRYRLGLVRSITPTQVAAGQQARVQLDLTNDGRMPTGLLLLEDQIPYVLGTRPRFVVDKMGPKWKRSVGYLVRSDVRGKFDVGPMKVRLSDPFGLIELERTFRTRSTLVVTPRVVPAARRTAVGGVDRVGRQPAARLRERQRRGRDGAGVPPRRRPAAGALAQQRARRRADGAP